MRAASRSCWQLARELRLLARALLVAAHRVGDLGEVAHARRRHDRRLAACCGASSTGGSVPSLQRAGPSSARRGSERLVERGHAVVVEARGDACRTPASRRAACSNSSRLRWYCLRTSRSASARALAVELVDRDEVGEVEHVDLLELAGGAELRRHHVQRHVDVRHDRGVALADAGGLDDDQVEAGDLARGDHVAAAPREISLPASRVASERMKTLGPACHGSIAFMRMRSPSSAPPRLAARRVDRDHRDLQRVVLVEAEAADQLVGQRATCPRRRCR